MAVLSLAFGIGVNTAIFTLTDQILLRALPVQHPEQLVARRTREIGIRMAIGASRTDVLWLVMREVVGLLVIGIGFALPASWGLSKYVQAQLYGIQPGDPLSIALAVASIAVVAALSGYLPARRAMRVEPMLALCYE